jgi:hypothetical protein
MQNQTSAPEPGQRLKSISYKIMMQTTKIKPQSLHFNALFFKNVNGTAFSLYK